MENIKWSITSIEWGHLKRYWSDMIHENDLTWRMTWLLTVPNITLLNGWAFCLFPNQLVLFYSHLFLSCHHSFSLGLFFFRVSGLSALRLMWRKKEVKRIFHFFAVRVKDFWLNRHVVVRIGSWPTDRHIDQHVDSMSLVIISLPISQKRNRSEKEIKTSEAKTTLLYQMWCSCKNLFNSHAD